MRVLTAVLAAALIASCGRAPQLLPPPGNDRIYEAVVTKGGPVVDVIDATTHNLLGALPLGAPSASWKHYYAVRSQVLEDIDPHSGAVLHSLRLTRPYDVPRVAINGMTGGLSPDGRWLVLETPPGGGQSHLLVVDTTYERSAVPVDLDGSYQFDGMSNNGDSLYLLHYLQGSDYEVRLYHVTHRYLDAQVIVDKNDATESMTGRRLDTAQSRDGAWQFTVYAREKKGAFIHALSLDGPYSLCINLPGGGWAGDPSALRWALALSPDGQTLYAVNGVLGVVVELSAGGESSPQIQRTHAIANPAPTTPSVQTGGVAVSPDGKWLAMAGATGIDWVDTTTLQPAAHVLAGSTISSLAMTADGRTLYAVRDSGEIVSLSATGGPLGSFDPKAGQPIALMRVESASSRNPGT